MKALSSGEVKEYLSDNLKEWSLEEGSIKRVFKFKSFVEAFSFMTAVALEAEKLDHHPDWSNVYNSVSINLSSHDANGITSLDFELAQKIESQFEKLR